jgi:hypothetical protein
MPEAPPTELEMFHQFQEDLLEQGHRDLAPEEVLSLWQTCRDDYAETVRAIQEGLDDVAAGRVQPLDEFQREFRAKHNIPPDE